MAARFRIVAASLGFLLLIAHGARAESIFVDRASLAGREDGSSRAPFRTITKALERARKIRFGAPAEGLRPSRQTIVVHVAAGTYVGSFAPSADPLVEKLPVLINVPRLKLQGSLLFDAAGAIVPGTETILRANTAQGPKQHMLVVTRTNPLAGSGFSPTLEMAGDSVTIAGFYLDGWAADGTKPDTTTGAAATLIAVDGVGDFTIRQNYLTHSGSFGIWTRLASGRVEGNAIVANRGVGFNFTGGSDVYPARLKMIGNRVLNNGVGGFGLIGAAQTQNDRADLYALHPYRRVPLPQYYDRTLHPEEVPDKLEAYLEGNVISGNTGFGFRACGYIRDQYEFHPLDPDDETANITARLVGNVCNSNRDYGVVVDAAQVPAANPRTHVVNVDLSFESTTLEGNGKAPAYFGFWRLASSVSAAAEADLSFKFAHESRIRICGDIPRFSYENRATDPTDLTPTDNSLTVHGTALVGTCVPLYGCIHELLPTGQGCK